jgi:hypothetical protein
VFVPGKPFQPGLIFTGKAKSLPEWSIFKVLPSTQILDGPDKVTNTLAYFAASVTNENVF